MAIFLAAANTMPSLVVVRLVKVKKEGLIFGEISCWSRDQKVW